jgi:DNA-binding PadR family transcriptional regulator
VFRAGSENIEDLHQRVKKGVSKLRGLEIEDELALELLAQLVEGKKTAAELVERAYGITSSDAGYKSSYGKVWRVIRRLESKGLISRKIFGKDKPYRLTELAVTNLARIGGEERQQLSILPRIDIALYLATTISVLPTAFLARGWIQLTNPATVALFGSFCVLLGFSLCRFIQALRRIL